MFDTIKEINLYLWIPIVLIFTLVVVYIFVSKKYPFIIGWFSFSPKEERKSFDIDEIYESINRAGYAYDPYQDIFYSIIEAWQRDMGYCRLYDEAAAPLNMIIDCEPIYFEYDGEKWLIEFWKGQYALTTGCEIGIYKTDGTDLKIPGIFNGTFYESVRDEEFLLMSFSLKKNGKKLFTRKDKHWWLTGFKLGEFSEPEELTMELNITLKNDAMRDAFIKGLKEAGYTKDEIIISNNTVSIEFKEPLTPQPISRIAATDWLIQRKNKLLCDKYQDVTKGYDDFPDKMMGIQKNAPDIFDRVLDIGKGKEIFKDFKIIKKYLRK